MARRRYSVFCRSISIPAHNVFHVTALPDVSNNFVSHVLNRIVLGLLSYRCSRFRFMRLHVWCLFCLGRCFITTVRLMQYFIKTFRLVRYFISSTRLVLCWRICYAVDGDGIWYCTRLWLQYYPALPRYSMIRSFVVAACYTSCTQGYLQIRSTLSSRVVCRRSHNYQVGVMVSLSLGGRNWTCILLGFSGCACRLLAGAL